MNLLSRPRFVAAFAALGASIAAEARADVAPPPPEPPNPAPLVEAPPESPGGAAPGVALPGGTAGQPVKDEIQTPRELVPNAKKRDRPFAGTQIFQQVSASTATFFPSQQQTYDPTVEATTFLLPRYALSREWQLRGRLVFNYEMTNGDATTTRNEPRFSDTTVQLNYRGLPEIAGFTPLIGAQIALPTSPESRARTMYFSPGLTAQLARPIKNVLGGELLVLGGLVYQHPVYRSTTSEIRGDTPYRFACGGGGTGCDGQLTGVTNASDILSWSAMVAGEWGKWSPAIFVLGTHQFAYAPSGVAGVAPQPDRATVRQSTYFSLWLDYNANAWLTAEAGYFMFRNVLGADGRYGNPFFDRNQDPRFYVGVNVNIDNFVKEIVEQDPGDGGIVRARNEVGPRRLAF